MPPRQGPGQPAHASPAYPLVGAESPHAAPEDGVLGAPRMSPLTESPLARSARPPWETDGGQQYPAGRPRRLLARFLDTLLPLAAAAAVGFLLFDSARDHVQGRVDEVEYAGVDQTVWLVDGTTGVYLAAVVGTFLVLGLLLEALPTALWGRTPGKILCGLRVVDLESQQKPSFGAALVRWLTHGLMAVMVVGVINVLWCLWDRPWRQCLHDKVAGTYVTASTQKGAEGTGSSSWS